MQKFEEEGYIKFRCNWQNVAGPPQDKVISLNYWREKFIGLGLIGELPDGTGFGNLSQRFSEDEIIISGSGTGGIPVLTRNHYSIIVDFSIPENRLDCKGRIKASSESLSHLAVYEASTQINAIIHIHDSGLWQKLIDKAPTTAAGASYGTVAMAQSVNSLVRANPADGIIIMKGHKDGIITYGPDLPTAANHILTRLNQN